LTDEEIIHEAKKRIKDESFVSIKWLMSDLLKLTTDINYIDRISCKITRDKRYIKYEGHDPNGFFVTKNPFYRNETLHDIIIIIISATLSLLSGYILWRIGNR